MDSETFSDCSPFVQACAEGQISADFSSALTNARTSEEFADLQNELYQSVDCAGTAGHKHVVEHCIILHDKLIGAYNDRCANETDKTILICPTQFPNWCMNAAARGNHFDIVDMCLRLGANRVDEAMCAAAWSGNEEMVKLFRSLGATDLEQAAYEAASNRHTNLVLLFRDWGLADTESIEWVMLGAAYSGSTEIATLCKDFGAQNFNEAMRTAAEKGHVHFLLFGHEWPEVDLNQIMLIASAHGHSQIVKLCFLWNATDFEKAFHEAYSYRRVQIVHLLARMNVYCASMLNGTLDKSTFVPVTKMQIFHELVQELPSSESENLKCMFKLK